MFQLFNLLLYQPLLNALVFFYNFIPDIGIAIIFLTIIIRFILWPFNALTFKSQKALQALQPEIKKIQEKYKNQRQQQTKAMIELYQKEKVNPFSSCLPILIQFPILIALFQVLSKSLDSSVGLPTLYPFIENPGHLSPYFLNIINFAVPSFPIALLAGIAQYFQAKMLPRFSPQLGISGSQDEKMTTAINRQMFYFMPALTVIIGISMPAGLTFYWLLTTLITIVQQLCFFKFRSQGRQ